MLKVLDNNPQIDKLVCQFISCLHRAMLEGKNGNVEFHVPIHEGKFKDPKEVRVVYHK